MGDREAGLVIGFARVSMGEGAELACTTCSPQRASQPHDVARILSNLESVAQSWNRGPGPNVMLGGFEPFAHPQLPLVVSAGVDMGYERLALSTDGGALSVGGNAAGAFSVGVRTLMVPILGPDEQTHDRRAAKSGLFAAARSGVGAFRQAAADAGESVLVIARIPLCSHTRASLPQILAAAAAWGASAAYAHPVDGKALDPQAAAAALTAATVNRVALFGDQIAHGHAPLEFFEGAL